MFLKSFCIIICIGLYSLQSIAQSDSFETKNILLKEIVIQNDLNGQNSRNKKQPKNLQISTDEILESIPGVSMIKRGNFALEPTIRGLNAGQINTTIDGMAMFGACTDRMDPISSYIEPNNLQNISVSFGPAESLSGNAIGGGFNFKIKQPRFNAVKKWNGMAGAGYESNGNAIQTLASINLSTPKWGLLVNGIYRSSQNYRAGKNEEIAFSQYNKWNGGAGLKYRLTPHSYLQANYIQDEGYNIGYPALLMDVSFAKAKIGSLTHFYHFAEGALQQVETKIYFNTVNHAMDDTKRPADQISMHMDMPGTSKTSGFYSLAKGSIKNHDISVRFAGYQNRLHAEMTMYPKGAASMYMMTIPDAQRQLAGINLSDKVSFNNDFYLSAGAGMDYINSSIFTEAGEKTLSGLMGGKLDKENVLFTIFLNPVYALSNAVSVYANTAYAMRGATLQELYGFYLFNRLDGYDYLGNPNLKVEKSVNISAGTIIKKEGFKIDIQTFGYFIENYITGLNKPGYSVMTEIANGVKEYGNLPSALLAGFEFSADVHLLPVLVLSTANTYTYGVDNEKNALPMVPPLKSLNQLKYSKGEYALNISAIISASQNHVNELKYGETSTSSSAIINMEASRDFKLGANKMSVQAGIQNFFDSYYFEHLDITKVPRMGRNIFGRITFYF
ncbi:MAG: TonB-dependent receptor [Ginsengibacter sp.]